jgi:hypothetical protein
VTPGPATAVASGALSGAQAPPKRGGSTSDNEAAKRRAQAEAQKRAQAEAQRRAQAEAQRRAQAEAQRRAQAEAQRRAQAEAQRRAQAEAQRRAQAEAQRRAQAEAQRRAQAEAQRRAQAEAQRRAQAEAQRRAQIEAQRRAQVEAQRRAQLDARRRADSDAQRRAQVEAQRRAQLEAQRRAQLEAQRRTGTESQRRAELEAQRRARLEAQRRGQIDTRRETDSTLRQRQEAEARLRALREAQRRNPLTETDRRGPTTNIPGRERPTTLRPGTGADRRDPVVARGDAVRQRRAELERRERERRQWILEEQARVARERAGASPPSEPRIRVTPGGPQATKNAPPSPLADIRTSRPSGPVGSDAGRTLGRPVANSLGRTPPPLGTLRETPPKPRPVDDPFVPLDPPTYTPPAVYVPPSTVAPLVVQNTHSTTYGDVHIWAPQADLVCYDRWPNHYGWWTWIHPGHISWARPVYHGWDIGWSWNLSFGFGHDDWWFGTSLGRHHFPYVSHRYGHGFSHRWWYARPFGLRYASRSWYRPSIAWYHDVCRPRTETVYLTVERYVPPPPPSITEAWDAMGIGRIGRAADLFDLILDARPGDTEARIGLAIARARLGDIALAAGDMRRALGDRLDALDFVPRDPGVIAELGIARTRLQDRLRIDTGDLDALLGLAVVLELLDEPAAAYHAADRAVDLGEVSSAVFMLRDRLDQRLLLGP